MTSDMDYTDLQDLLRSLVGRLEYASQNGSDDERETARQLRQDCAVELQRLHAYDDEQLGATAAKYRTLADRLTA